MGKVIRNVPEQGRQLSEDLPHHHLKLDHLGQIMTHLSPQFYSAGHYFQIEEMSQKVLEFQTSPAYENS